MRFAKLSPDLLSVIEVVDIEESVYLNWVATGNPKAQFMRYLVTDAQPTFDPATQVLEVGPYVIEATQVRETWVVRAKTAAELEADALAQELQQVQNRLDNLVAAIDEHQAVLNVPYNEPAPAGSNALEIAALRDRMRVAEQTVRSVERDLILTMRSTRWLLREAKQRLTSAAAAMRANKSV